jgi:transcriptional regulator with XRE-family HTH domain
VEDRRSSPVLLRWMLGEWLREIREARGLTGSQVARQLGWAASKISRIENHEGITPGDVRELLDVYEVVSRDDIQPMVEMARQAQQRGWWHTYGDMLPRWFATYIGLEAGAVEERDYRGALVTGLLQTPDYARAVIGTGIPGGSLAAGETERLTAMRMERQHVLRPPDPLKLWALMEMNVLRRVVGSPAVMREQLRHLADMAELPNITIQVIPEDQVHPALDYPFTLLLFRQKLPGLVYVENFTNSLQLEEQADMNNYAAAFDDIARVSLSLEQSRAAILDQAQALAD